MAIDREARNILARELRRFALGRITDEQLEETIDALPQSSDRGVRDMVASLLIDDFETYPLNGSRALTREGRRECARWILFLRSDEEYLWPSKPWWLWLAFVLVLPINLLTLGYLGDHLSKWHDSHLGARRDLWPFFDNRQYAVVAGKPPRRQG